MQMTEVLICGAGPTGLVLALWLSRFGVRARIIDKATEPGQTSRALVVHARTLELYNQLGLAAAMVERGQRVAALNIWARGKHKSRVEIGDIGLGLSPYPFILIFPQDEHKRLLIEPGGGQESRLGFGQPTHGRAHATGYQVRQLVFDLPCASSCGGLVPQRSGLSPWRRCS